MERYLTEHLKWKPLTAVYKLALFLNISKYAAKKKKRNLACLSSRLYGNRSCRSLSTPSDRRPSFSERKCFRIASGGGPLTLGATMHQHVVSRRAAVTYTLSCIRTGKPPRNFHRPRPILFLKESASGPASYLTDWALCCRSGRDYYGGVVLVVLLC